ncbi:SusC/RagA family TonB-linked outer membrane protein [Flavisolibacter nicotianae]|uniref:SusC/RagA family TonB-linked outer membrane protein n=1 Tax=Flavisolibacter nicotianae TaxID=2364882 RepID=UPI000EAE9145|nr:TonB-dependent receptor [Flavisolibacter nicotianae]
MKRCKNAIFLLTVGLLFSQFLLAQNAVQGKVTDDKGTPLPGVSVRLKNSSAGTSTDSTGVFRLALPEGSGVLVISSVGYTTQEMPVKNRSGMTVRLVTAENRENEVVVIGYGTTRKKDLTGSVTSLNGDDFNKGLNTSVTNLIAGRAPGVNITQTSSEPGGGLSVRIRGASSVNGGNDPLYVIDGLPVENGAPVSGDAGRGFPAGSQARNPLNALNPNDIESVEILKDASAAAIYGSRGANGVILITTKKGKTGALQVTYDTYRGTQKVARSLPVLSTSQYIQAQNELAVARGGAPLFSQADIAAIGAGTNWQDLIFRDAPMQNHNLSFSGGAGGTRYYASLNYYDQDGVIISSGMKRYIGRINLEHKAGNFRFGMNLNSSLIKDDLVAFGGTGFNAGAGIINAAIQFFPTVSPYDSAGNFARYYNIDMENPLAVANGVDAKQATSRTFGNIFGEYTILPGLKAKLNLGSDYTNARRDVYNTTATKAGFANGGIGSVFNGTNSNYLVEATLDYVKSFHDHRVSLLGGYTYQYFLNTSISAGNVGFPSDLNGTNSLGSGSTTLASVGSGKSTNKLQSYLGRINYDYKGKYLLTATLRADGSSRFGINNKYGYFPSFSGAWQIGQEAFMRNLPQVSSLKLRAGYGLTGNQDIGNLNSVATFNNSGGANLGGTTQIGQAPTRIPNPDLKWESTAQFNVGVDLGLVGNRVNLSVDYFRKNTKDMLLNLPVSGTSGFTSQLTNIGSIENKGWEFLLETKNLTGLFNWTTTLNAATLENTVKDIGPLSQILTGSLPFTTQIVVIQPGFPLAGYYGYRVSGVFQTGDDIAHSAQPAAKPGYLKFEDVNGDGKITTADRTLIGNPLPRFTYGISNSLSYKNFGLDFFLQGVSGVDILNQNLLEAIFPLDPLRNSLAEPLLNRWTSSNPGAKWPSLVGYNDYSAQRINSLTVEDASYLRLKNITLSYQLPLQNGRMIKSARIYLSGQNLKTFTHYSGYDPEVNVNGDGNVRVDYNAYPLAKTYLVGLNIGF